MALYRQGIGRPGPVTAPQTAAQKFQAAIRGRPAQPVTPPPIAQKIDALRAQTDRGRLAQRLMPQPVPQPAPMPMLPRLPQIQQPQVPQMAAPGPMLMLPRLPQTQQPQVPQMAAPAPQPIQQPAPMAQMLPAPSQAPLPVPEPAPQISIQDTSIGQTPSINNPTPDVTDGGSIMGGPAAYPRYTEQDLQASIDAGKVNQPVTVPNIGQTTPEDLYNQYGSVPDSFLQTGYQLNPEPMPMPMPMLPRLPQPAQRPAPTPVAAPTAPVYDMSTFQGRMAALRAGREAGLAARAAQGL